MESLIGKNWLISSRIYSREDISYSAKSLRKEKLVRENFNKNALATIKMKVKLGLKYFFL